MNLVEVNYNEENQGMKMEITNINTVSTEQNWNLNKNYVDGDLLYAANDLISKSIRKGYKLRVDYQNIPAMGKTVITKIVNGKGYVESYHGQRYIAFVRVIDLRK